MKPTYKLQMALLNQLLKYPKHLKVCLIIKSKRNNIKDNNAVTKYIDISLANPNNEARWDIVRKALEILNKGFQKKMINKEENNESNR